MRAKLELSVEHVLDICCATDSCTKVIFLLLSFAIFFSCQFNLILILFTSSLTLNSFFVQHFSFPKSFSCSLSLISYSLPHLISSSLGSFLSCSLVPLTSCSLLVTWSLALLLCCSLALLTSCSLYLLLSRSLVSWAPVFIISL